MKVTSASDYSWLYSLLNNTNRVQTSSATKATTSSQQVGGIANIDGDSFVMSGMGQARGSVLVGTENDSSTLDLRSFLDKVKNGTVTQDDLTAMQEKLNSMRENAGAQAAPPPPPPPPQGGEGDQIKTFLDKVAAGTVTDEDLTAMQTWLSGATQSSQGTDGTENPGDQLKTFLDKVAAGTVTDEDLTAMQSWLSQAQMQAPPPPPPPPQGTEGASSSGDQLKTFLDKVAAGTVTDEDLTAMQTWLSQTAQSTQAADDTNPFGRFMANALYEAYNKTNS